jgi:peptidoglycan hydrolase-like protein with peptidoglycan-binding domain
MTAYDLTREQSVDLIVRTALEYGIIDKRQIAYMLASAEHETGNFRTAREDDGPNQARIRGYSGGENYYGRGYVQTTHDHRYADMDKALGLNGRLIADPDLAARDANLGAQLLVVGMSRGIYTGVGLDRYINANGLDYLGARAIVNGNDKDTLVAGYAERWERDLPQIIDRVQREGVTPRAMPGSPFADGQLSVNERGPEVARLQEGLIRANARDDAGRPITPDGDFGGRTSQALLNYKREYNRQHPDEPLPLTPVADQRTLTALGVTLHQQGLQPQQQPQQPPPQQLQPESAQLNQLDDKARALYRQIDTLLGDKTKVPDGTFANAQERSNAALALTAQAYGKLNQATDAGLKDGVLAVSDGRLGEGASKGAHMKLEDAVRQTPEESLRQIVQKQNEPQQGLPVPSVQPPQQQRSGMQP